MHFSSPLGYPGSIPETVMRTGTTMIVNPYDARHDITEANVERFVRIPVGMQPGSAVYSLPPQSAMSGFGADAGGDNTAAWLWGLVGVLSAATGYVAYRRLRARG